jgi:RNA polymerase subunit RPABC4/transcription elongation factor Spt4
VARSDLIGASAFGSVHDLLHSTAFDVVVNLALFLAVVFWLGLAHWVYRDARRRIDDPWLVGTAVLLGVVPYIGPVIFLLFRPPETLDDQRAREVEIRVLEDQLGRRGLCPVCRAGVEPDFFVCPVCTTRLKQACRHCAAALEPRWRICPYCATSVAPVEPELVEVDIDAALTAAAAATGKTRRRTAGTRSNR